VVDHDAFKELIARYSSLEEELERLEDDRKVKEVLKSKDEVKSDLELVVRSIEAKKEELERIKKLVEKMEVSVKERTDRLEKTIISYTH
jgi:Tfp pilus assembly protein FimV